MNNRMLCQFLIVGALLVHFRRIQAQTQSSRMGDLGLPSPRHPSVLLVKYEGQAYPVIAVSGKRAVIMVAGKRIKVPKKSEYIIERGDGYASGEAVFTDARKRVTTICAVDNDSGATISGYYFSPEKYEANVTVSERHEHSFFAVLFSSITFFCRTGRMTPRHSFISRRSALSIQIRRNT